MDRLDEALTIAKAMFTQDQPTFEGRTTRSTDVLNVPQPDPGGRAADPRRRRRRAADAQDRGQARRHDALVPARPRGAPAQEGRPREALRGHRARPRRRSSSRWRRPCVVTRNDAERGRPARQDPRGAAAVRDRRRHRGSAPTGLRPYLDDGFTGFTFNNPLYATPEQIAVVGELLKLLAGVARRREAVPLPGRARATSPTARPSSRPPTGRSRSATTSWSIPTTSCCRSGSCRC